MKKISIITVVYNDVNHISSTIESVLNQDFPREELEYIIIDGASTDGTVEKVLSFGNRIDKFISEPDKGIYNAMNKGCKEATGEWCLFLNSGDRLYENSLDSIRRHYSCDISLVYGDVMKVFTQGNIMAKANINSNGLPGFSHQSAFIRTSVMKQYGYDENYKICADMDFFKRIFDDGHKFEYCHACISYYDMDGFSSRNMIQYYNERISIGMPIKRFEKEKFYIRSFIMKFFPQFHNKLLYYSFKRKLKP